MMNLLRLALFLLPLLHGATPVEPFFLPIFGRLFPPFQNPFLPPETSPIPAPPPPPPLDKVPNPDPLVASVSGTPDYETLSTGSWELVKKNAGVSAMHIQITTNNKAIMFDATVFGPSQIALPKGTPCRPDPTGKTDVLDCWAHAVEYDLETANVRPLKVLTDTWCSSGGLDVEGTLVQTGGWKDGGRAVRYLKPCQTCDWQEYPTALSGQRWYATQHILPDGGFILVGGRRMFSYEYVPPPGQSNAKAFALPMLRETTDTEENNLYPFVYLSTDGNVFIFANNRSILLDVKTNKVVRELPPLPGGSRSYPASGSSSLLPLDLRRRSHKAGTTSDIAAEVIICGGNGHKAAKLASNKIFQTALRSCGRIVITNPAAQWRIENMPTPRVMSDMLLLPNAEVLMINGASKGTSGWSWAVDPVLEPLLYRPKRPRAERFRTLASSNIARMYHSSSAVLPDGSILVGGSNTNNGYNFTGVDFPTELRVEKFYPPYLDEQLAGHRPKIDQKSKPSKIRYGEEFSLQFTTEDGTVKKEDLKVTMYLPPFTTHSTSMNQRLLILQTKSMEDAGKDGQRITVTAPRSAAVAPPGYYLAFLVNRGVPSKGVWVQIK